MVIRNVIIREAKSWDWNQGGEIARVVPMQVPMQFDYDKVNQVLTDTLVNVVNYTQRERPTRSKQIHARLNDYEIVPNNTMNEEGEIIQLTMLAGVEPLNYQDAMQDKVWKDAMKEELSSIEKCGTWKLNQLPERKKLINVKWIFKVKLSLEGTTVKHKARLVARGFLQRQVMDYFEVFAPVAMHETIRLVMALAYIRRWTLSHMDVKPAFINGPLDEEVYVSQHPGFEIKGK